MSRTDVHAPYWTQAVWYEPVHDITCEFYTNRLGSRHVKSKPCDLPERAVRHGASPPRRGVRGCTWEPIRPRWRQCRWLNVGRVPKWYCDHVWHNVERVRTRDGLRDLAREYDTDGVLADGDFPNWQARHGAPWYWD